MSNRAALRGLPQVQRLLELAQEQGLMRGRSRASVLDALRLELDAARTALLAGKEAAAVQPQALLERAWTRLAAALRPPCIRRVINATGIVLHTNLGRAALARTAVQDAVAAAGYCSLEFDLATGERGSRTAGVEHLLTRLAGAEAGLAVNNCAAAMLLALSALAAGAEVVVSRGELIEIGGGFRIPDVIQQGGARLVEVGTTNKTRLDDYARAITPATRVLLKVHRSNFSVTGFTQDAGLAELSALAHERGLLLVHDLGSGTMLELEPAMGMPAETTVQQSLAAGVDVVAFSGDKLLGGPQAGLLAGQTAVIGQLRKHPLLRALRLDKLSLAALEATLRLHLDGAWREVPALGMMAQGADVLQARAERLAGMLGSYAQVEPTVAYAGGGTLPASGIASAGIVLLLDDPEHAKAKLRENDPPVIARIAEGHLRLDMLTVSDAEVTEIADAVRRVLGA